MIVILIVVIFVLTYDPKSGTLDRYITGPTKNSECADDVYRGNNPAACKDSEYNAIQFAKSSTAFMKPIPTNSHMGAIISQ